MTDVTLQPLRRLVLAGLVSAAVLAGPAQASPPPGMPTVERHDRLEPPMHRADPRTVRLNYFNESWVKVLESVAEDSGSTLIKLDLPPGRVTRRDGNRYTRDEAIAILNAELEPLNFRILAKDQYLAVVHRQRARSNYRPRASAEETHAAPDMERPAPHPSHEPAPQKYRREVHTIAARPPRPADPWDNPEAHQPDAGPQPVQPAAHRHSGPPGGRQVGHTARPIAAEQTAAAERPTMTSIRTERRAADVAKFVYDSLRDRSELIDVGPEGLPAFRVYRTAQGHAAAVHPADSPGHSGIAERAAPDAPRSPADVHFEVGIDTDRNELVLSAVPSQIRGLADLIRKVDQAQLKPGQTIRLVAGGRDPDRIVTRLRPALRTMVAQRDTLAQRSANGQRPTNGQPVTQPDPEQPFGPAQPPAGPLQPREDFPAAGVRGDVEIEVLPGGLLLLRGNLEDVEAVQDLIRRIQELAQGTTPDIELLMIQHVNSEALAELLTQVYDTLNDLRGRGTDLPQTVAFIPIIRPNALLILAPRVELDSILKLAGELDQPLEPGTQFEVFRLKNAIASQVATTVTNLYPAPAVAAPGAAAVAGLAPRVTAIADARTNTLIVRARTRDLAEVTLLVSRLDGEDVESVAQMRVFELRNAVADELAQVITGAMYRVLGTPQVSQAAGQIGVGVGQQVQISQEFQTARSMALEFLTTDGDARRIVRSGILSDIRVTADARTNSLIVTAPAESMQMMAELIRRLDQPTEMVAEIKVFTLENSDASAMITLLQALFQPDQQQQQFGAGIQVATAADASSGLIPLRFSVDVRTNSVIAVGAAEALRVVEAILLRLDQTDIRQRQNAVIKLRNTPALDIGNAINQFLQSQRDLFQIDPNLITNVELLEREIIAVPEPVSNSIIISATPRYFEEIRTLIERLDAAPPQVIIQALLVEVELTNTDELGVELGFQDDILFNRSTTLAEDLVTISETFTGANQVTQTNQRIISQATTPGFQFNNQPLGRNVINPSQVGSQGLSNFSLGRTNADLGFGGLVLSASSSEVSILIRALSARRTVHVLSRPQITTLDNQAALIQVGQDVPLISSPQINPTTGLLQPLTTTNTFRNVGIIMEVIPRITPDDNIVMEVIATRSNIAAESSPLFTDPSTGTTITSPIFNITTARSTLSVPNGQTIVMGGMITKSDDTIERKVPWLGDLPLLGTAFRYDSTSTRRTELLIFLTPRIIRSDADFELIKQVEAERLHFIEEEAELLHGPLYSVPPVNAGPRGGAADGYCPPGGAGTVTPLPGLPIEVPPPANGLEPRPLQLQPTLPFEPGSPRPVHPDDVPTTIVPPQSSIYDSSAGSQTVAAASHWSSWDAPRQGAIVPVSASVTPEPFGTAKPADAPAVAGRKKSILTRLVPGRK
ncbi:MAG TPA: secretin N-terminal domain-containing protein [Planctomycetaceae bacterium]|nr:secretin N-terminal domain-containing protein [Planctomycetaceae bacterium]